MIIKIKKRPFGLACFVGDEIEVTKKEGEEAISKGYAEEVKESTVKVEKPEKKVGKTKAETR
ncbi:hypothetical protein [Chondrinema litorale]|uniref:hypothetical protein n=1 Tax=Chondrinema litorale TaxID=2994555 RepID=UPI0025426E1A|nr:hypothetical protein [Chondrinema litorale]UZS00262.1 hypothetical protein OQ292_40690 [Chondrinema litorale]